MLRLYCKNYTNNGIANFYHIVEDAMKITNPETALGKDLQHLFVFLQGVVEGRLK